MAHRETAPYAPQDTEQVANVIKTLEEHTKKGSYAKKSAASFSCKKSTFTVDGTNGKKVDSWKFQDWDYKRPDLPTYARGLFTHTLPDGKPEIVTRGYDKFFNIDEVTTTKWPHIENNTRGPYELSVKENGCIIFISGLDDDTLLVCSKHSTGARADASLSHAKVGEKWVDQQLEALGKTRQDLAQELRKMNATAVAELCDDSFEEHVLQYDEKLAGLYLHGINLNVPDFATYPGHLVHEFADQWGFKKAEYLMKDDINSARSFLEEVAETGAYHGKETEGFVIRCQARDHEDGPWYDWFFKYKFEEPYLMYRQWREVTKATIAGKPPRYKKHRKITEEYLEYARHRIAEDPSLADAFKMNHGIIAMREGFLKERGLKGSDIIRQEEHEEAQEVSRNLVLVPVATIGCGKTTVAIGLTKLFGWGHVQNDNIQVKKGRLQKFSSEIYASLLTHPAMIADKNNHQKRERKQLIDSLRAMNPEMRFVALHYVHDPANFDVISQAMRDRVLSRGDNHQTIQAGSKSAEEIISIMDGFLERFEPLDAYTPPDDGFDSVIDLDPAATSRQNLETIVSHLHQTYPRLVPEMPSASALDQAIDAALTDYKPDIHHTLEFRNDKAKHASAKQQTPQKSQKPPKQPRVEYFAIQLPAPRITAILDAVFSEQPSEVAQFYHLLNSTHRIQNEFHVTLMHRNNAKADPDIWDRFVNRYIEECEKSDPPNPHPLLGTSRVQLERIVWDARLMCFVARLPDAETSGWCSTNPIAHVTVGTASADVKPKESNDLLQKWIHEGAGDESGIKDIIVKGQIMLDGKVRAVLSK
ncbi:MAG: hypothetical protein M1819_000257 [Sarea resinae]|nr:MAG: hypothetical protein M1819_000257 [Sarea resinae]